MTWWYADVAFLLTPPCVSTDAAEEYHGCIGVWGGYNRQFTFAHNEICRVNYGGISLGWGWAIPWQATFQRENEIAYNKISHWLRTLDDSGATYTLGPHMNSTLHHNYAVHGGSGIEPGAACNVYSAKVDVLPDCAHGCWSCVVAPRLTAPRPA